MIHAFAFIYHYLLHTSFVSCHWYMCSYIHLFHLAITRSNLRSPSVSLSLVLLPGLVSRVHQVLDVVVWSNGQFGQILNVGSHQRVLSDTQVSFVLGIQQVTHTLTVDLHVTHLQEAKSRLCCKMFLWVIKLLSLLHGSSWGNKKNRNQVN